MSNLRIVKSIEGEAELLEALKQGDAKALEQIFHQHYDILLRTASKIVVDGEKAKDIVQEVFEQLWKKRVDLKITTGIKPYLSRAVANRAINEYKRLRKRNESDAFENLSTQQNAQDQLEFEELNEHLKTAIDGLPERCKLIFIKCRLEQKSHQEIADELNISKKTIENQMTKALKTLRAALLQHRNLFTILFFIWMSIRGIN